MSIEPQENEFTDSSLRTRSSDHSMRPEATSIASQFQLTEQTPTPANGSNGNDSDSGQLLGDFDLIQEVGRGGMGVVYEARQRSLGKRVAVKVLPNSSMLDQKAVKRFQNEAWTAAQLQHRSIVPVYQVGNERGICYYSMRFIDGVDLGELFRNLRAALHQHAEVEHDHDVDPPRRRLSRKQPDRSDSSAVVERARNASSTAPVKRGSTHKSDPSKIDTLTSDELIDVVGKSRSTAASQCLATLVRIGIHVADALHYAHEMGIIHRDVKPSNLLLDLEGEVWVSDFGLAKIENNTELTATGAMVGTLRYMSPEQILGSRVGVDHRTDVYSLGVTLYELLTLRRAFHGENREEIIRKINFDQPVTPRRIDGRIPIEIDTIVMKALSKNPADRYQTAAELADDLRRFRNNEPIKGRKPSIPQRMARWAVRNRALVSSAAALLLTTFVAALVIAGITWDLYAVTAAALETEQQQKAEIQNLLQRTEGLRLAANSSIHSRTNPTRSLLLAIEGAKRLPGAETNQALIDALDEMHELHTLVGHPGSVGHVAFNHDGSRLVSAAAQSRFGQAADPALIWNTETGDQVGNLHDETTITSAVFSPDRFRILTASSPRAALATDDVDGKRAGNPPCLWDAVRFEKLVSFQDAFAFQVESTSFDPLGRRVVFPSLGHRATIYDCVAGHPLVQLVGHEKRIVFAAFSPQGDRVVTASDDNTVRVWNADSGELVYTFDLWQQRNSASDQCLIQSVAFRHDGRQIATGSTRFGVHLWDLENGQRINQQRLLGSQVVYWPAAFQLMTRLQYDSELVIRSATDGETIRTLSPLRRAINKTEISPDGQWIAVQGSSDSTFISLWNAATGRIESYLRGHPFAVDDLAFSPDSRLIATAAADGLVRIWHRTSGRDRMTYPTSAWLNAPIAIPSGDGKTVAVVARNDVSVVRRVDFQNPDVSSPIPGVIRMRDAASTHFVTMNGNRIAIHSVADGKETQSITSPNGNFYEAAINPTGDRVAAVTGSQWMMLWIPEQDLQIPLSNQAATVQMMCFGPNGDRLAVADAEGSVRLWDANNGELLAELQCDAAAVAVVFDSQNQFIVAATDEDRALLWDQQTHQLLQTFASPGVRFNQVAFNFDGTQLIAYHSEDSTVVSRWDVATGKLLATLDVVGQVHVAMHPDQNESLVTSTTDGAMIWRFDENLREPISPEPMICGSYFNDGTDFVLGSFVPLFDQPWQIATAPRRFSPAALHRYRRTGLALVDSIQLPSSRLYELVVGHNGSVLVNTNRLAAVNLYDSIDHQLLARIDGHPAAISDCRFTFDSERLVTTSWDHTVAIWDARDGAKINTLHGHQAVVNCLAISSDDRFIASGSDDGQVIVWDAASGEKLQQLQLTDSSLRHLAWNHAGTRLLALTNDDQLLLYDINDKRALESGIGSAGVRWAEYSPDGSQMLVVPTTVVGVDENDVHQILIVPVNGGTNTALTYPAPIVTSHFYPDGRRVLTATQDGNVTLRDVVSGDAQQSFSHSGELVIAASVSPDGHFISVNGQDRLTVWKVDSQTKWLVLPTALASMDPLYRYNPFVPNSSLIIGLRNDRHEFRSWPIEPLEFGQSQIPRALSPQEKQWFSIE